MYSTLQIDLSDLHFSTTRKTPSFHGARYTHTHTRAHTCLCPSSHDTRYCCHAHRGMEGFIVGQLPPTYATHRMRPTHTRLSVARTGLVARSARVAPQPCWVGRKEHLGGHSIVPYLVGLPRWSLRYLLHSCLPFERRNPQQVVPRWTSVSGGKTLPKTKCQS